MTSELDQWVRLRGQHMISNDRCLQPHIALWFSRRFSKSPLLADSLPHPNLRHP